MRARGAMSTKWMALLIGLSVFLGAVWWAFRTDDIAVPVLPVATPLPVVPSRPPPPPERDEDSGAPEVAAATPPPPTVAADPLPTGPAVPALSTPRPPKHPVDPEALARESALLERARQQVTEDPEVALRTLVEHEQLFPAAELAQAAQLVRLEALLRLGRRDEAEKLARKLTGRDPAAKKSVTRLLSDVRPN